MSNIQKHFEKKVKNNKLENAVASSKDKLKPEEKAMVEKLGFNDIKTYQ